MFPWSIFLPVGFWSIFKKTQNSKVKTQSSILRQSIKTQNEGKGAALLLVWFFAIFGFFTASSTKLPTYIFPCFISLAVIAGVLLDDFLKRDMAPSIDKSTKASYYLLILIMLLGWLGGAIYAKLDYPVVLAGVVASGLVIAFGGLLSLILFVNKKYAPAFAFIAYSVAASLFPLSALILPDIELYETSKEVSRELLAVMKPGEALGSESNHLAGLAFYTGKFPVDMDKHHIGVQFLNSKSRVWAVIKEKNHKQMYDPVVNPDYVKPSYMVYRVGKRAIVTNEVPEDGRFLVERVRLQ
jgi:hypothetical protein